MCYPPPLPPRRIRLIPYKCLLKTLSADFIVGKFCPVSISLTAAVSWLCKGSVIPSFLIRSLLNDLMFGIYFLGVSVKLVWRWKILRFIKRREDPRKLSLTPFYSSIKTCMGTTECLTILLLWPNLFDLWQVTLGITGWETLRVHIEESVYYLDVGSSKLHGAVAMSSGSVRPLIWYVIWV